MQEIQVPHDWMASEKGNTWLCDDDGNHVAWIRVGDHFIEVSVTPDNSPGLWVRVWGDTGEKAERGIVKHINKSLKGWTVRRCNLEGVGIDSEGMVKT